MHYVDHLVYATPDLEAGITHVERLLGVRASAGGQHGSEGTHNALLALGDDCYLEILAPDPTLPQPAGPRWFDIDNLTGPRLVTWAARGENLEQLVRSARAAGVPLGTVRRGSRLRADGTQLAWQFTDPHTVIADGIVPFLIDWGESAHPAGSAARGANLLDLRAEHSDPVTVVRQLAALDINLPVTRGARPLLVATIETAAGRVELR